MDIRTSPAKKKLYLDSDRGLKTNLKYSSARNDYSLGSYVDLSKMRAASERLIKAEPQKQPAVPAQSASYKPSPLQPSRPQRALPPAVAQQKNIVPTSVSKNETSKRQSVDKKKKKPYLLAMSGLILLTGLSLSFWSARTQKPTKPSQTSVVLGESTTVNSQQLEDNTAPDESPVPDVKKQAYTVSANMPRFLRVGELKIDARILRLGTTKMGAVAAPYNIYDTGWYEGSNLPGEVGSSLIVGHNQGYSARGVFADLAAVKTGATIEVVLGSGKKINYKVESVKTIKEKDVDMQAYLNSKSDKSMLYLMTCTGKFDRATKKYDSRVVVSAVALP